MFTPDLNVHTCPPHCNCKGLSAGKGYVDVSTVDAETSQAIAAKVSRHLTQNLIAQKSIKTFNPGGGARLWAPSRLPAPQTGHRRGRERAPCPTTLAPLEPLPPLPPNSPFLPSTHPLAPSPPPLAPPPQAPTPPTPQPQPSRPLTQRSAARAPPSWRPPSPAPRGRRSRGS